MKLKAALAGLALLPIAGAALAQPVYRIVDKNGKVTFSDQPPSANAQPAAPRAGSSVGAELPACPTNCARWRSATRSRFTPATSAAPAARAARC